MPQRSNEFQRFIARVEKIIHADGATVTESAMVYNHAVSASQELDVLVSFAIGGRKYLTGIQIQDRSRKATAEWVNSSAKQRDQMRLSKMVLVHSKGFTKQAIRAAEYEGIELITPLSSSPNDTATAIFPLTQANFKSLGVKSLLLSRFDASKYGPSNTGNSSLLPLPNFTGAMTLGGTVFSSALLMQIVTEKASKRLFDANQAIAPNTTITPEDTDYPLHPLTISLDLPNNLYAVTDTGPHMIMPAKGTIADAVCCSYVMMCNNTKRISYNGQNAYRMAIDSSTRKPIITCAQDMNGNYNLVLDGADKFPYRDGPTICPGITVTIATDDILQATELFPPPSVSSKYCVNISIP